MILFVEGPRGCGKTFLINNFLQECKDPRIEYYKFYFANHIKMLGIGEPDNSPSLHYYSLGNIMTIMEMNLRSEYKNKIWIFDRAIISAYTWATLRQRLDPERAKSEYLTLIHSDLYKNSKTIFVKTKEQTIDSKRKKDQWDGIHTSREEQDLMANYIDLGLPALSDQYKQNRLSIVYNTVDSESISSFNSECYRLLNINPNK